MTESNTLTGFLAKLNAVTGASVNVPAVKRGGL